MRTVSIPTVSSYSTPVRPPAVQPISLAPQPYYPGYAYRPQSMPIAPGWSWGYPYPMPYVWPYTTPNVISPPTPPTNTTPTAAIPEKNTNLETASTNPALSTAVPETKPEKTPAVPQKPTDAEAEALKNLVSTLIDRYPSLWKRAFPPGSIDRLSQSVDNPEELQRLFANTIVNSAWGEKARTHLSGGWFSKRAGRLTEKAILKIVPNDFDGFVQELFHQLKSPTEIWV